MGWGRTVLTPSLAMGIRVYRVQSYAKVGGGFAACGRKAGNSISEATLLIANTKKKASSVWSRSPHATVLPSASPPVSLVFHPDPSPLSTPNLNSPVRRAVPPSSISRVLSLFVHRTLYRTVRTFIKKFSVRVSARSAVWNHLFPQTEHSMMRPLPRICRLFAPRGKVRNAKTTKK